MKSTTGTKARESREVTAGGHTLTLAEPEWYDALEAVQLYLKVVGDPEALFAEIQAAVADDITEQALGAMIAVRTSHRTTATGRDMARLLALVTDRDAAWYMEPGRFDVDDILGLVAEAASVIPFASTLRGGGAVAGAYVTNLTPNSAQSADTSADDADGDLTTLPVSESSGPGSSVEI